MTEKRSETPKDKPVRLGEAEKQATGLDKTMQTEFHTRRARGRLSREDQRRLGDVLQRVYDDVLRQGVPDRFKILIDQLGHDQGTGEASSLEVANADHLGSSGSGPTREVQARSTDRSKDESR